MSSAKATTSNRNRSTAGGLDGLQKRLESAKRSGKRFVKVGLPAGSGEYPDGTPVILVGAVNEFGSEDGTIPERSFLRAGIAAGADRLNEITMKIARGVIRGETDPLAGLEKLGAEAATMVARRIVDLRSPPNAASTLAAKKPKTNPLVNTGLLGQSITHQVVDRS